MEHLTDCHTHTWYSGDGRCSVGELCAAAYAKGLAAVAVTDHFDYAIDGGREAAWDLRAGLRSRELRQAQADWSGRLEVLRGIEIGQPHWNPEDSRKLAGCGDFDLVIGSIHDLRPGKRIYHDYDLSTTEACDALYQQFFHEAREMLRTCDFDVFGHYDYPLRKMEGGVVPPNMERWKDRMLPFLKDLAQIIFFRNRCPGEMDHLLQLSHRPLRRFQVPLISSSLSSMTLFSSTILSFIYTNFLYFSRQRRQN